MHKEVLMFDELRKKVKEAKALNKSSPVILQRYKRVSTALREKLIKELGESRAAVTKYHGTHNIEVPVDLKGLYHKISVIRKILSHEWNMNSRDLV